MPATTRQLGVGAARKPLRCSTLRIGRARHCSAGQRLQRVPRASAEANQAEEAPKEEAPSAVESKAPVSSAPEPAQKAQDGPQKLKVVVVGAGWAGFGAAKHLASQGYDVKLLDASPNPGGLSAGWRTRDGKTVEAGMKGFWYTYSNIFKLVEEELGITDAFTPYTKSGFWSPTKGLVTESPVFSELPRLPTLLGQFVHTVDLFRGVPLPDRASMLPLFPALLEYKATPETYKRYDQMTFRELCRQCGVSNTLYEEFMKPLLLVGLFAPPEELSAGVVLEMLYYYALAHQNDFDVKWARGSVSETIFQPLMAQMREQGCEILGGHPMTGLEMDGGRVKSVSAYDIDGKREVSFEADHVVLCMGVTGMQKLVQGCAELGRRREFRNVMHLRGIDVMSVRVWFDKKGSTQFPSNVLSGFEPNVGGTFFNLNELHDEYKDCEGSVIAADFYHAGSLLPLSDEAVAHKVAEFVRTCEPSFEGAKVTDFAVLRFPKAVTHFTPGSYPFRPLQTTSIHNLFVAGDWVKGLPHGSQALCQERAYVAGLRAANLVIQDSGVGREAEILDVEPDEPHIAAGKYAARLLREGADTLGIRSPFLFP